MSHTFSIVCHETKKRVWIGQGWDEMSSFYSGDSQIMDALKKFLSDHEGKPLVFLCNDKNEEVYDFIEYGEVLKAMKSNTQIQCSSCGEMVIPSLETGMWCAECNQKIRGELSEANPG